jgi:acetyl-CoA carboxylase carboxyltransferase component
VLVQVPPLRQGAKLAHSFTSTHVPTVALVALQVYPAAHCTAVPATHLGNPRTMAHLRKEVCDYLVDKKKTC